MANNHDIPELMPVPEQLHVFDVYRMRVRFEDDPTKSRDHYVAAIVIQADDDGGVAVKLTSNPTWHGAGDVQLPEYEHAGLTHRRPLAARIWCCSFGRIYRDSPVD